MLHLRTWAYLSTADACFILSFSSSVSILLLFCLFIHKLLSLWISIIVRQKLAERKIRNSNSKKKKDGGESKALENLAIYTATPCRLICLTVILEPCHCQFDGIFHQPDSSFTDLNSFKEDDNDEKAERGGKNAHTEDLPGHSYK